VLQISSYSPPFSSRSYRLGSNWIHLLCFFIYKFIFSFSVHNVDRWFSGLLRVAVTESQSEFSWVFTPHCWQTTWVFTSWWGSKVRGNIVPGTCLEQGMTFGLTVDRSFTRFLIVWGSWATGIALARSRGCPNLGSLQLHAGNCAT